MQYLTQSQSMSLFTNLRYAVRMAAKSPVVTGMATVLAGISVGLAGAFALTRLLASLLYGIATLDTATFVFVPLLLMAVAIVATYIPARRASSMDPATALRHE